MQASFEILITANATNSMFFIFADNQHQRMYTPLSRWIAGGGGIKVYVVSNVIYTGRILLEGEGDLFFLMKRDEREEKVLSQDM